MVTEKVGKSSISALIIIHSRIPTAQSESVFCHLNMTAFLIAGAVVIFSTRSIVVVKAPIATPAIADETPSSEIIVMSQERSQKLRDSVQDFAVFRVPDFIQLVRVE